MAKKKTYPKGEAPAGKLSVSYCTKMHFNVHTTNTSAQKGAISDPFTLRYILPHHSQITSTVLAACYRAQDQIEIRKTSKNMSIEQ